MKSSPKSKIIILIALGILFALSSMITVNLSFITGNNNKSSKYNDDINLDKENLKLSKISERIHIINNSGWAAFKDAGNCTGEGTYSEPYVIEDLVIDGGSSGSGIWIENSSVYFRIENCTVYNSGGDYNAGILLNNMDNGFLIDNNCSSNCIGIGLFYSDNNTISENTVNINNHNGIYLSFSDYNTISGNNANNNNNWYGTRYGIRLRFSNNSIVSGNSANDNYHGIDLHASDYNIVSGNIANSNVRGIIISSGNYNTISGNTVNNNNERGIDLTMSNYNIVSGNTANNNGLSGIYLCESDFNTVSGNTANNNDYGRELYNSDYNTILNNVLLGNDECIRERNCEGNILENNDCGIIPGYSLFFLLGTLSVAIILISKKLKKF